MTVNNDNQAVLHIICILLFLEDKTYAGSPGRRGLNLKKLQVLLFPMAS